VAQGPSELWRAVFEASGFTVRRDLELAGLLDGSGGPAARRIVATGGGSFHRPWVQAMADATGLPVDCVREPLGAALGSAFLARVAAGLEPDAGGSSRWAGLARCVRTTLPALRGAERPPLRSRATGLARVMSTVSNHTVAADLEVLR
jgi:xylulokinase